MYDFLDSPLSDLRPRSRQLHMMRNPTPLTKLALRRDVSCAMGSRSADALALLNACFADMTPLAAPATAMVVGLMNAGKSTLLNALLDAPGRFAVGDARTTTETGEAMLGSLRLVDTPGLDVRDDDDAATHEAMLDADVILFVHSAALGEFDAPEIRFLRTLTRLFPDPMLRRQRLVPVLTKIDSVRDASSLASIAEVIEAQWSLHLDLEPTHFLQVSGRRYLRAFPNRTRLLALSRVPEMREWLSERSETLTATRSARRGERARAGVAELITMVREERALAAQRLKDAEQRANAEVLQLARRIDETKRAIDALTNRRAPARMKEVY